MKPRLLISLTLCALLLAACYRQTEEPFQQIDSAEVVEVIEPAIEVAPVEVSGDTVPERSGDGELDSETIGTGYITPEVAPGQVEQPTISFPTAIALPLTSESLTITPFVRPTDTPTFEEQLDPTHECVYAVVAGDNLFRLSLGWNTTVQEIMDTSQIDSDELSIGQLLLIPGCDYSPTEPNPTVSPAIAVSEEEAESEAESDAVAETTLQITATPLAEAPVEVVYTPTPGPRIHVVSSGETLESISLQYRVDINAIIVLNNLANPDRLNVGQELLLPD